MSLSFFVSKKNLDDRLSRMGIKGWSWEEVLPFFKKVRENDLDL